MQEPNREGGRLRAVAIPIYRETPLLDRSEFRAFRWKACSCFARDRALLSEPWGRLPFLIAKLKSARAFLLGRFSAVFYNQVNTSFQKRHSKHLLTRTLFLGNWQNQL